MEIILLIVGLPFLLIGVGIRMAQRKATQGWQSSRGEVIGHVAQPGRDTGTTYAAILKFSHLGSEWFVKDPLSSNPPQHVVGKQLPLRVSTDAPLRVSVESRAVLWFANVFALMGALAIGIFFVTFRWNWFSLLMTLPVLLPLARAYRSRSGKGMGLLKAVIESRHLITSTMFPEAMTREQVDQIKFVDRPLVTKLLARQLFYYRSGGFVLLVIGLAGLWGGELWLRKRQAFLEIAKPAPGTIVRMHVNHSTDSTTYAPIVQFREPASQKDFEFKHRIASSHPSYREGDAVGVLYDPRNPRDAMIDGGNLNLLGPLLALLGAATAILFGVKAVRSGRNG